MNRPSRTRRAWLVAALLCAAATLRAAAPVVRGRVTDTDALPLPGVLVTLTGATSSAPLTATTNDAGDYAIAAPPGRYRLTAQLSGFATATRADVIVGADPVVVNFSLPLAAFEERVTVTAAPTVPVIGEAAPDAPVIVTREVIDSAMLPNSQYDDVLTLMPNVIRGPDGLISVAGARASQGALLVNGVDATDPITGAPGIMLPIEAVDGVQVYSGGYPATFGHATGGVTSVVTRSGADRLHMSANSFFPRMLFADGGIHGVEFWEPNTGLSAPLIKDRAYIEQAISYRYDRNRFDTLVGPQDSKFTALLSWTQADVQISPRQRAVVSVSIDPQNTDRANITAFTPAATVPQLKQGGWSATLADHATIGSGSTLEVRASSMRTDLTVTPNGDAAYELGHDLTRGNYFDRQDLHGQRSQATISYVWTAAHGHVLEIGGSAGRSSIEGGDGSGPVDLLRSDLSVSRTITFAPDTLVAASTTETSAFIDDAWHAAPWLTVDAGARYDRSSAAAAATMTPRLAFTLKPKRSGASVSGSAGLFADKLVLAALAFPAFPARTIQAFDAAGAAAGPAEILPNIVAGSLRTPRATQWDLSVDDRFDSGWLMRAKYQERHGRDELLLAPSADALTLSSGGASTARSLETTVGYRAPKTRHEIYLSYVRASTHGDLNTFDSVQGMFKTPFVQPNAAGPLATDVPNRVLAWGLLRLPGRVTVAPFVDVRSGFPYSAVDENWLYVGQRNGQRLPWFGSLDLYVNKIVGLPGRLPDARVGLKLYNMASAHSARDVQTDVERADFGTTYNPVPRDFTMVFELLWGNR